jgi:predicted house-cleaning NTP pyrophosphatase (Maf/HAM1 superfamily)
VVTDEIVQINAKIVEKPKKAKEEKQAPAQEAQVPKTA